MTYISVRLDDYLLCEEKDKVFEEITDSLIDRMIHFTVGVVAGNFNGSLEQVKFLSRIIRTGNEVAIHGYWHSDSSESYEFERGYQEQKMIIEQSVRKLRRFLGDTISIIPPFYRGNSETLDALHQISAEFGKKFVLSTYYPDMGRGLYWDKGVFLVNQAIDLVSDWKDPQRPIRKLKELYDKLKPGNNCLVIHPYEHNTIERRSKLESILDIFTEEKITPISLCQLAEVYENGN